MIAVTSIVLVFVILVGLLHLHVNNPDNIYFIVAREWQTLISAIVGFMSLAVIFVLTNTHNQNLKHKESIQSEIAYISLLSEDFLKFQAVVQARHEILTGLPNEIDALKCTNLLAALDINRTNSLLYDDYLITQIAKLTPATMNMIVDNLYMRNAYIDVVNAITVRDCMSSPEMTIQTLMKIHLDTKRTAKRLQSDIETYKKLLITISEKGYESKFHASKYGYIGKN